MLPHGKQWIRNFDAIASSAQRKLAFSLVNAALNGIATGPVLRSGVTVESNVLRIQNQSIELNRFRRIYLFGIGKAASEAAKTLCGIMGERIAGGVVIGREAGNCDAVRLHRGDHPLPTAANVEASRQIAALAEDLTEDDLALVVVSGGGSAHLCWPESELEQGRRLYADFVRSGGSIIELNTVRKHLSELKGGGLAKMLYPATVIGLIFSDVPGDKHNLVASGPTYRDESTREDAARILEKYRLSGYSLGETPKENCYFDKVSNVVLVSNQVALAAMRQCAVGLGLKTTVLSDCLYEPIAVVAEKMLATSGDVVLAGGEPDVKVPQVHGQGGRNQLLTLQALSRLKTGQLFISFGSDGEDNGPNAGAIADELSLKRALSLNLDPTDYLTRFDAGTLFEKTGGLIVTGPTEANVSDLMVLLNPTSEGVAGMS